MTVGRVPLVRRNLLADRRRLFVDFNLLSALSGLENVTLACNLAGTTGRPARDRATELLPGSGSLTDSGTAPTSSLPPPPRG